MAYAQARMATGSPAHWCCHAGQEREASHLAVNAQRAQTSHTPMPLLMLTGCLEGGVNTEPRTWALDASAGASSTAFISPPAAGNAPPIDAPALLSSGALLFCTGCGAPA